MRLGLLRFVVCLLPLLWAAPARAQELDLLKLYRQARLEAQAARLARLHGARMDVLPPTPLPTLADAFWQERAPAAEAAPAPEPPRPAIVVHSWRPIRRLERTWFERNYGGTNWAYLGNTALAPLDTSWTRALRARLEAQFGAPTQTLAESVSEHPEQSPAEFIQFEYWLLVNDSIPVLVMDAHGPFDRGLVVAADQQYRAVLDDLRQALWEELSRAKGLAPYVDYFYDLEEQAWYRTGYDGRAFFTVRIPPPNMARGRPYLEQR